ncbi:MAG: zinc metallopeptidase [Candidatus Hydrogenedentes bacterium]|nr:zinc metallopeptidase [Candidatus Hydrogenedentota bacterium]
MSTFYLLIPVLIFSLWAQWKVKSAYARFAEVGTRAGLSGAEVASRILYDSGIALVQDPDRYPDGAACSLEPIPGQLSDHYDPRAHALRLSQAVYHGRSIAALGIAAHEVGHAIQHARAFAPLQWRSAIYPISRLGSGLAFPLFFLGLIFRIPPLLDIGILVFTFAVCFTLITLPVEFDASRRALRALANGGYLTDDELAGARKVLSAAAMTYVAAAAMAVVQLVRMLILRGRD